MQTIIKSRTRGRFLVPVAASLGLLTAMCAVSAQAKDPCGSQDELAEADRLSNRISWVTKSETMSSHFEVFRAEQKDGEYQKLNAEPIPASGWSNRPKRYEFVDSTIDPCMPYFYYVEAVSAQDQSRDRIVPPTEAKPKVTRDGES